MTKAVDVSHWGQKPFQEGQLTVVISPGKDEKIDPIVSVYLGARRVYGLQSMQILADVSLTRPSISISTSGIKLGSKHYNGERYCPLVQKGDAVFSVKHFFKDELSNIFPVTSDVIVRYFHDEHDLDFGGEMGMVQTASLRADTHFAVLSLTFLDIHSPDIMGALQDKTSEALRANTSERIRVLREIPYIKIKYRKSDIQLTQPGRVVAETIKE